MTRLAPGPIVATALTTLLAACDVRVTHKPYGSLSLEHRTWTIPGPCPKDQGSSKLYDGDGKLVLDNAENLGTSPDKVWTLWRGGETGFDMYAIDHRSNALVPMPWGDAIMPESWCPSRHRFVSIRSGNPRDRVLIVDLTPGKAVSQTPWYSDHSVSKVDWSPDCESLALLVDRGPERDQGCQLLHMRSFALPEVTTIESKDVPSSGFTIVWENDAPRLQKRP